MTMSSKNMRTNSISEHLDAYTGRTADSYTDEEIAEINIYNIVGISVFKVNSIKHDINVSDFAEGVYFISIKTDKGEVVKRFIKK